MCSTNSCVHAAAAAAAAAAAVDAPSNSWRTKNIKLGRKEGRKKASHTTYMNRETQSGDNLVMQQLITGTWKHYILCLSSFLLLKMLTIS